MRFNSLRYRVTLIFIALATFPLVLVGGILGQRIFDAFEQNAIDAQQAEARQVALQVEKYLDEREEEIDLLDDVHQFSRLDVEEQRILLGNLMPHDQAYQEMTLLDWDGQEKIRLVRGDVVSDDELVSHTDDPAFTTPLATGEAYYSPVVFDPTLREPLYTLSVPLTDLRTGEVGAVLLVRVRFKPIWDLLAGLSFESGEDTYITDGEGRIVAHRNPSVVLSNQVVNAPNQSGRYVGLKGEDALLASERVSLGNEELVVISERSVSDALQVASNSIRITGIVTLGALIVAIGLGFFFVAQLVRPIQNLSQVAQEISDGDISKRVTVVSQDEIGTLGKSFNRMTDQLEDLIHNLERRVRARTQDLQIAADLSQQVTTLLDLEDLLPKIAELTRAGYDLYHVSVFLLQDGRLVLNAATGEVGVKMMAQKPSFSLEQPISLIPLSARKLEPILANGVQQDARFLPNPMLPETASELALPMVVGGRLIGVMDLQSTQQDRFGEDEVRVMTTLAEQLAVAVQNAQLYAEQIHTNEELRELDKLKNQFMASISHELRTPLNAILNMTQFVLSGSQGEVNEQQKDSLEKAYTSGKHLLSLINDIMDMTKIETGRLQLFIEDNIDPKHEVVQVMATANGLMDDTKPVKLEVDLPETLPQFVGDRRRVRQILLNLVGNAIKFTDKGKITVRVIQENGNLVFSVRDTGPGILPEQHETIFEPFRQGSEGLRRGAGTGLGLPISRRLAEAHEGKLWLESEVGQGTTFFVSLPIHSASLLKLME